MRVLAVVHGRLVRPELFGELIRAQGHELLEWEIAGGGDPPDDVDAVLVLGGDMNVGEEAAHPWLEREYTLLRGWVGSQTPLLAICLGAQTLAHAFGGRVAPLPERLAGFLEVSLTAAGAGDPVVGVLPARFDALFANAYAFDLPDGAVELVSRDSRPQGYRLGHSAWALQFHPEARLGQVLAWLEDEDDLLRPLDELRVELAAGMDAWHALGTALCGAFLDVAAPLRSEECRRRARPQNDRPAHGVARSGGRVGLERQVASRPLVPGTGVVARVVPEPGEDLHRDGGARSAMAVGNDLGARREPEPTAELLVREQHHLVDVEVCGTGDVTLTRVAGRAECAVVLDGGAHVDHRELAEARCELVDRDVGHANLRPSSSSRGTERRPPSRSSRASGGEGSVTA